MASAKKKRKKKTDPNRVERLQEGGRCLFAFIVTLLFVLVSAVITFYALRDFFFPV